MVRISKWRALVGRSARLAIGGAILGCAIGLVVAPGANAEDPLRTLDGNITDEVGAIDGREDEVLAAIDALYDQHRIDLYVAYVDDFSGLTAAGWTDDTAQLTAMRLDDVLLAVATSERQYALSVDPNYPISDKQLRRVQRVAVEPALKQHDWAGAAIGAANGLAAVRSQQPVVAPEITPGDPDPAASSDGGGGSAWLWITLGLIAVAAVTWFVLRHRRMIMCRLWPNSDRIGT